VNNSPLSICISFLCLVSNIYGLEPLISSSEYSEKQTKLTFNEYDTNKDSKITKEEAPHFWKKHAKSDSNKDNTLEPNEVKLCFIPSMGTAGKELVNVKYKETPQGSLYLDIYYPDKDSNTVKPVIFYTHGGGWATGDKSKASKQIFSDIHKAWLKEGFVIVSIGYRLVNKHNDSSMRDCVIDCKDAMRFISGHKEDLGIDPNKFYTFGDSAGGHLAMMMLHTSPSILLGDPKLEKFDYNTVAGVSWYGPCDFQNIQLFNHDGRANFRDRFGPRIMGKNSSPADKDNRYKEMSPVTYLTKNSAPLLMIQGDKDTTIPVKQAYRMQEALKDIHAPVEIQIIKNTGHNWRSVDAPISPTRKEIISSTINFLVAHKK